MSFCVDGSHPFSALIFPFTAPIVSLGSASIVNFCCFKSLKVSFMVAGLLALVAQQSGRVRYVAV